MCKRRIDIEQKKADQHCREYRLRQSERPGRSIGRRGRARVDLNNQRNVNAGAGTKIEKEKDNARGGSECREEAVGSHACRSLRRVIAGQEIRAARFQLWDELLGKLKLDL